MPQRDTLHVIDGSGLSYATALAHLLGDERLSTAIVASAFLTEEAAERLLLWLGETKRSKRPKVHVLIGSMHRFTRAAAVRALLRYSADSDTKRARNFPVAIHVLHPTEPLFHLKSVYGRLGSRVHRAIVGSHNLTSTGLECRGEMGILLTNAAEARMVGARLERWRSVSTPWRSYLRTYSEARLPSDFRPRDTALEGVEDFPVGETAALTEVLTPSQFREAARRLEEVVRLSPTLEGKDFMWLDSTPTRASTDYPDGARFDCSRTDGWVDRQRRALCRVLHSTYAFGGRASLVFYTREIPYRLTPALLAEARRLKIDREDRAPDVEAMRAWVSSVRRSKSQKA